MTAKMLKEWPEFKEKQLAQLCGIIAKCTLLETSIVPVPANPNATQTALAKSAVDGDSLTDDEKKLVRKAFDIKEAAPEPDARDDRIKSLESEVRDLKAKTEQLITEKATADEATRATLEQLAKATLKTVRSVEVVASREVEVVAEPVDIKAAAKHAVDICRGLIG